MTTTPDGDAASILGPITPIRCPLTGCHWSCHGVPDKYADSRARIIREHMAAEHTPTTEPAPAAAWVDDDPLMEAIAAAVYEQCESHPETSVTIDDPRNIAAVAATTARRVLGETTTDTGAQADGLRDRIAEALLDYLSRTADIRPGRSGELAFMPEITDPERLRLANAVLAVLPAPADRVAVLREAASLVRALPTDDDAERFVLDQAARHLRHTALVVAEQEQRPKTSYSARQGIINYLTGRAVCSTPRPPAEAEGLLDAHRAAILREAADAVLDIIGTDARLPQTISGVYRAADHLRRMADEAQQPTAGEAYPARHEWRLETHDPLADEWNQGSPYRDRADAVARHQLREERFPTWKDGTRVERRIVRVTTTYTVEQPAPAVTEEPTPWVPKRVSLGTPCAGCRHARNWHTGDDGACTVGECRCTQFATPDHATEEPTP